MILFFDASALIYRFEGNPPFQAAATRAVTNLLSKHPTAQPAISRLSLLECRVKPLRDRNQTLLQRYERFFTDPALRIVDLDARVIDMATRLRAENGLKTPDALQAASALLMPEPITFLTGDGGFERVSKLNIAHIKP